MAEFEDDEAWNGADRRGRSSRRQQDSSWHLSKELSIGTLISMLIFASALIAQLVAGVRYVANEEAWRDATGRTLVEYGQHLERHDQDIERQRQSDTDLKQDLASRLARMETMLTEIQRRLDTEHRR